MKKIQLVEITAEEHYSQLSKYFDNRFEKLEKLYQPKEAKKYLKRDDVAEMLSVDVSSIHNMTKKGILQKYQISGRVLYVKSEVESAIIKLKN